MQNMNGAKMNYQMPVRAIKNILKKEIQDHTDGFYWGMTCMSGVQKEMISIAKENILSRLESCNTHDELDDFLSYAGYCRSLEDWINSL